MPLIARSRALSDSSITLLARCVTPSGDLLTRAAVSSLAFKVYDMAFPEVPTYSSTPVPSGVVYDVLLPWDQDQTGANVRIVCPSVAIPSGSRVYRAELEVVPVGGDRFFVAWECETTEVLSAR